MNHTTCGAILVVFFTIGVFGAHQWYQNDPYFEGYSSNDGVIAAQTYNNLHKVTWDDLKASVLNNYQQSTNFKMEHPVYWGDTPGVTESTAFGKYQEPAYSKTDVLEPLYASDFTIDPHWGARTSGCTFYSYYDPFSFLPPTDPHCNTFFSVFGFFNNPFNVCSEFSIYEPYSHDIAVDLVNARPSYNNSDLLFNPYASYKPLTSVVPESPKIHNPYYEGDAHATDYSHDASYYRNDPNFHYYSYYTSDAKNL